MSSELDARWKHVSPVSLSEGERLLSSRLALGEFLATRFQQVFDINVDEVLFETFPDGLYATLYVSESDIVAHNVWAVALASALSDAGVDVSIVVRSVSDRLT